MTDLKRVYILSFLALILTSIIISIGLCVVYVRNEQPLYYWDYGAYWGTFKGIGQEIKNNFLSLPRIFLQSVRSDDYNVSSIIPLFPFYWIFGGGRSVYLISIAVLYLIPAAAVATKIACKSIGKDNPATLVPIYLIAVSYTPFWAPTLRGYVDIVGLFFLGLATLVLFRSDFLKIKPFRTAIILGVLVWLPFLFRRWYAYSSVAFFISAFIFGVFTRRREQRFWREVILLCLWLGSAGLVAAVCAFSLQSGLVMRAITTSYADLYAVYQVPFHIHLLMARSRLGYYVLFLTVSGAVVLLLNKKNNYGLFCLVSALITFGLFIRIQELGNHHFLPVAFWLFPAYLTGVEFLSRFVVLSKAVRLYPAAIVSLVIFYFSVIPSPNPVGTIESFFVPAERSPPLRIENFPEYKRLASDLAARLKEYQHFAVFASSHKLSDVMLVAIDPSLLPYLSPAPHLAAVDGFPFDILRSEYAVAATPPQTHLALQANIKIPGDMLLNKQGFGAAFENEATYKLANGITAYLFHRQRPVTAAEMKSLLDELDIHYPGWKSRYDASMAIPFATRETQFGDVFGVVSVTAPNSLFMHPGATTPTIVDLPINGSISKRPASVQVSISRDVLNTCPDADGVSLTVKSGNTEVWNGVITPGQSKRIDLPQVDGTLEMVVDKRLQPQCDWVYATFLFPR